MIIVLKEFSNILLVSGSGRNCGKTTVACDIIQQIGKNGIVFGLKISPHFHRSEEGQQIIESGPNYKIFSETDLSSGKDSSRMLAAGAKEVYFVQCTDAKLMEVSEKLKQIVPIDYPIVCESGSFANFYKPGLHILVVGSNADETKKSYKSNLKKAELIISSDEFISSNLSENISFSDMQWTLSENDHD